MKRLVLITLFAAVAGTTAVSAEDPRYPPPSNPGGERGAPTGPFRTRTVCADGRRRTGCVRSIQAAIDASAPGDRVVVPDGTYREAVRIVGRRARGVRLVGDRRHPGRVVLDGGGRRSTGITVRARDVTVRGFTVRGHSGDGVRLIGAVGGVLANVVATGNGGAGIALRATPEQVRPVRTMVRGVRSEGNRAGLEGDGLRYATIATSRFSANGFGFVLRATRRVVAAGNRIAGNVVGAAVLGSAGLVANALTGNDFTANGRDLAYAGGGEDNCFADNTFTAPTVPADGATFTACPFAGANPADAAAAAEIAGWWPGASR